MWGVWGREGSTPHVNGRVWAALPKGTIGLNFLAPTPSVAVSGTLQVVAPRALMVNEW